VKVIVLPIEDASTFVVAVVSVPEPLAAFCVIDGWVATSVSVPPAVPFCWVDQVTVPVVAEAVAPGPPEAFDPYVTVIDAPPARVRLETTTVCPAKARVPPPERVV
jgi:hypothetical protein